MIAPRARREIDALGGALTAARRTARVPAAVPPRLAPSASSQPGAPVAVADRHPPGRAPRRHEGPPRRRRRGGPRRDPRPVAPDPRRPGARLRGAPRRRRGSPRSSRATATRSSTRPAASPTAIRAVAARRARRRRPADRDPRRVRRAARARPRLRPQHDGRRRASVPRSPSPSIADELPGEIVFLGTPAEERGSGKADHDRRRPVRRASTRRCCTTRATATTSESWPLASEDVDVVFHGLQAHASSDPWKGRNALDAMILLFSSVGLWRQQLRPTPASTGSSARAARPRTSSRTGRRPGS